MTKRITEKEKERTAWIVAQEKEILKTKAKKKRKRARDPKKFYGGRGPGHKVEGRTYLGRRLKANKRRKRKHDPASKIHTIRLQEFKHKQKVLAKQ